MTIDDTDTANHSDPTAGGAADAAVRRWTATSRFAAVAVTLWAVVLQILARHLIPPVLVIGAVFGVLAVFLAGARRRLTIVVGILGVLAVLGNLPGVIDDLSHPSSGVAFSLTLWASLAAVLALVAGVGALTEASGSPLLPGILLGGVFAMGLVVALAATTAVVSDDAVPDDVRIVARKIEFRPESVEVAAGETGFWVDNQDGVRHTFTVEGTTFELDVPGYSSKRGVTDLEPGVYTVVCEVPGHENMTFQIIVG